MTSGRSRRSRSREGRNRNSGRRGWGGAATPRASNNNKSSSNNSSNNYFSRGAYKSHRRGRSRKSRSRSGGRRNNRSKVQYVSFDTRKRGDDDSKRSARIPRSHDQDGQDGHKSNNNRYRSYGQGGENQKTRYKSHAGFKSDGRKRGGEKAHRTRAQSEVSTSSHTSSKSSIVHFNWKPNMELIDRMYVLSQLGEGTFGRVLLVDYKGKKEAVKIIRDVSRYRKDAEIEHRILMQIREKMNTTTHLSEGHERIVRLHGCFTTTTDPAHYCLSFEPLGQSLYSVLKQNNFQGFYMEDLYTFAKHGLQALQFLDAIKLAHTDLKPENLLLVHEGMVSASPPRKSSRNDSSYRRPQRADIKIIDFGGATFEAEHHSQTISTRQYRAPEVLIESGWGTSVDMFSFGCILMELYSGKLLLQTHECCEHLYMLEKVIGPFHTNDLNNASRNIQEQYLRRTKDKRWYLPKYDEDEQLPRSSVDAIRKAPAVMEIVNANHRSYGEFCLELMRVSPKKRIRPGEALKLSFFDSVLEE